jgi:hypothetical protein
LRRDGTRKSCVGFWCYCIFLLIVPSKIKKYLPYLGTKIEEKYRHILQDTAVPVFIKERKQKHDVNKIYVEDYCEWP